MNIPSIRLVTMAVVLLLASLASAEVQWPRMTESFDGVPISFEVTGQGEPVLVFIHGWSCDARYWRAQIPYFASAHKVVSIDLAGHGHSGLDRDDYTMAAFGQDVKAVLDDLDAGQAILIGHSMGGPVSVKATELMPDRVIGIVGVDTFQDVGQAMSEEESEAWIRPLREDFRHGAGQFVPQMFIDATNAELRDWVTADMSAAPPNVAISAMSNMLADMISGRALSAFSALDVPVVAINADIWPTDVEGNQEHQPRFEAVIMDNTDHFLHMAEPDAFNRELQAVITRLVESR
ncbi:MAG: alpha/beta hydrolase [Wenzhouxiangellaceae bacterium]|nr:MAG: alpha/beta hydrolase [Wenzhouxiangellaceae bacterium]